MLGFKLNKELGLSHVFLVLVILFGFWSLIALTPMIFIAIFQKFKSKETTYHITLLDLAFAFLAISEVFLGYDCYSQKDLMNAKLVRVNKRQ